MTCGRSQSEFAAKSESELSSLQSQPGVLSRLRGRLTAKMAAICHACPWQRLLCVRSTQLPSLIGHSARLLFPACLAFRHGHMTGHIPLVKGMWAGRNI